MAHGRNDDLYAALQQRLLTSGEYDRIQALLRTRLNEAGWIDAVRTRAQEISKSMDPLSGKRMLEIMRDDSTTQPVPDAVRREIVLALRQFVDKQFE
ncbi:hypothetical protein NEOLEDRAFT_1127286 [Neolentinus lepideus HHB14362 ss-1]|uniref:Transcription and mRNA export factor SUS1 n=1 Tax=Neolentinus lepideus HHB14362 ss-1 TaxID=1314782 RepID=A0A165VWV8_9AGAM|nr:hypothetical protein NEOLEDRAFT_1127286 [Neolentinus lepideus HHB14362 ss-1]